jgi:hypothetical protein
MPKVLVLYYSAYGHIEAIVQAVAEGVGIAGGDGSRQPSATNWPTLATKASLSLGRRRSCSADLDFSETSS